MNRIHGINFNSSCSCCGQCFNFCGSTKDCDVKHFSCNHFKLILIKINDHYNNFKLKITIICNRCLKVHIYDFNIGKIQGQSIRTDENFNYICCTNALDGHVFLSEEELALPNQISNNQNNYINQSNYINQNNFNLINQNPIINNNNSINVINDNSNNIQDYIEDDLDDSNDYNYNYENEFKREIERFEQKNIIEFDKKNILLNFLDDETNKLYKIYTKSDLKLESVLEDLVSQFPELSYKNKRILINNNNANLSSKINSFNLNAQSNIIIK